MQMSSSYPQHMHSPNSENGAECPFSNSFSNSFQSSPTTRYSTQLHLSPSLLNHSSLNPAIRVFSPNILPLQFLSAPLPPTYTPQFKFLGTATSSILGALSFKSFMI